VDSSGGVADVLRRRRGAVLPRDLAPIRLERHRFEPVGRILRGTAVVDGEYKRPQDRRANIILTIAAG